MKISVFASFVFTALCAATLVSCVQEAVVYDDAVAEIGIAPASGVATKIVSGAMNGTYDSMESFGVFAFHKITEPGDWSEFYSAEGEMSLYIGYIDNGQCKARSFVSRDSGTSWGGGYVDNENTKIKYERFPDAEGYKKGEGVMHMDKTEIKTVEVPYYWPKTGSLAFAGYSPYEILDIDQSVEYEEAVAAGRYTYIPVNGTYVIDKEHPYLLIEDFRQGDYVWFENDHWAENETVDLMWFDIDDQKSASSGSVSVEFRHACAWLDFRVYAKDDIADKKFSIYDVVLSDVYWQGTFKSDDGSGNPVWELPVESSMEDDDWNKAFKKEVILFDNNGSKNNGGVDDSEFVEVEKLAGKSFILGGLMVIPQDVKSMLTVKYKQFTSDSQNPLLETLTFDLATLGSEKWEMGKHYVYDIVFGLDEIKITPSVRGWDETGTTQASGK